MSTKGTNLPSEGERLASALRAIHPRDTAKQVARDIDVSPRAVKSWIAFDESMPQASILLRMFRKYGAKFMAALDPEAEWAQILELNADIAEANAALTEAERRLQALGWRE